MGRTTPVLGLVLALLMGTTGLNSASPSDTPELPAPPERTDIEKVYDLIEVAERDNDVQKRLIRQVFDLSRPDVSRIMLTALNDPVRRRGEKKKYPGGTAVMAVLNYTDPEKGLNWLLDHYANLNPHGRAGMVGSLRFLKYVEAFTLLEVLLKDRQAIDRSVERPLDSRPGESADLRVRDLAYNAFLDLLSMSTLVPDELLVAIKPTTPLEQREKLIKALDDWWQAKRPGVRKDLHSLEKASPVHKKIEVLRLKLESRK